MELYSMQAHRLVTPSATSSTPESEKTQGTRMHIYRWLNSEIAREKAGPKQLQSLPILETKGKWTKKIHPGASYP